MECPRCRAEVAEYREVAAFLAHNGHTAPEGSVGPHRRRAGGGTAAARPRAGRAVAGAALGRPAHRRGRGRGGRGGGRLLRGEGRRPRQQARSHRVAERDRAGGRPGPAGPPVAHRRPGLGRRHRGGRGRAPARRHRLPGEGPAGRRWRPTAPTSSGRSSTASRSRRACSGPTRGSCSFKAAGDPAGFAISNEVQRWRGPAHRAAVQRRAQLSQRVGAAARAARASR